MFLINLIVCQIHYWQPYGYYSLVSLCCSVVDLVMGYTCSWLVTFFYCYMELLIGTHLVDVNVETNTSSQIIWTRWAYKEKKNYVRFAVLCGITCSQRALTMFVGSLTLCYLHRTTHVLCGVDNRVPQLPQT